MQVKNKKIRMTPKLILTEVEALQEANNLKIAALLFFFLTSIDMTSKSEFTQYFSISYIYH